MLNQFEFLSQTQLFLLDRDGCLNKKPVNSRYVQKSEDIEFFDDALRFVKTLISMNRKLAVITNQRGISMNLFALEDVVQMHKKLCSIVGIKETDFALFVCPHEKDTCDCRKPSPKMLLQACQDYKVKPQQAVFIGDSVSDFQAAKHADMSYIHINRNGKKIDSRLLPHCVSNFEVLRGFLPGKDF